MIHWISFTNELPARDVTRIRKLASALQGGYRRSSSPPTTHFALGGGGQSSPHTTYQETLRAGSTTSSRTRRSTRYFYRTDVSGQRLSSQVYTLHHGGPLQVAREIARTMYRKHRGTRRQRVPSAVRAVVDEAVANGYLSQTEARKYCDKYAHDMCANKILVHIREKGKHRVRQYEASCSMIKHPTRHHIREMKTKVVHVAYVHTFAC